MIKKMIKIFLALLIFSASFSSFSQVNKEIEKNIELARDIVSSNPDSAMVLYSIAEAIATGQSNKDYIGNISYGKARYYVVMTDYGHASEELKKAILFYEENNNLSSLASAYALQSVLLDRIGDKESSHFVQVKACAIAKESGDMYIYSYQTINLILDYLEPGSLDSAYYFLKEMEAIEEYIVESGAYYYYQNWGMYYFLR